MIKKKNSYFTLIIMNLSRVIFYFYNLKKIEILTNVLLFA